MASQSPQQDPLSRFGPNEVLVEEMYQRYLADPDSVDEEWLNYFRSQPSPTSSTSESASTRESAGTGAAASTPPDGAAAATSARTAEAAARTGKPSDGQAAQQPSGQKAPAQQAAQQPAAQQQAGQQPAAKQPATAQPAAKPAPSSKPADSGTAAGSDGDGVAQVPLRGAPARTAKNMVESLTVPTATSVREVPVKLLIDNRIVINNHLARDRGGKVSFTHLIGYAIAKAAASMPEMNNGYAEADGKPVMLQPGHLNLGLAIDVKKSDGTRQLLVPNIKHADSMDFGTFWRAYEDVVQRTRDNKLSVDDFANTTISLTNPGMIGTTHSVPRLMAGQGAIIGVGSMEYPAAYQGAAEETLNRLAVSKIMTLTSTYDHRVIQGAQSGEFLKRLHELLLGDDFYDEIFAALRIPYEPVRWVTDIPTAHDDDITKQARVLELIHAYRVRGHLIADTNPLGYEVRKHDDLDVVTHDLTLWDLDREFATGLFGAGKRFMKLRNILGVLRDAYCRKVGIEYMHIQEPGERRWIQERVELKKGRDRLSREEQLRVLSKLNEAEAFETFLQTKYVGQKRFSMEGGESAIALLDEVCEQAANAGMEEVTIGMAHRGRLNVLANIARKSPGHIFREFEGNLDPRSIQGSGDVKYHLGSAGEFVSMDGKQMKVSVAANPSHLEAVNPVLEGIARAKQDILDRGEEFPVLPVLVHGDAAFAGQGVVSETLNLSQLRGYRTGGTVHVVINNQVGFTTPPSQAKSSTYCTDVARMVQAPIFHVNGDDPEACVRVARIAFEYRQTFGKDIVIDVICYRRRGHNEGDDPSFTQPKMHDLIQQKRSVRKLYTEALIGRGDITVDEAEQTLNDYQKRLEGLFAEVRAASNTPDSYSTVPDYPDKPVGNGPLDTSVPQEVLKKVSDAYVNAPEGFTIHPKVRPQLERRAGQITDGPIDWATSEIVAFGSLLLEGRPVRLSGQDSRRGTFVQRFASIVDRETGGTWVPLHHLGNGEDSPAPFHIYDSLLSEYAAMGFEYGYSVARPGALVMWEGQFGDFANGAQTIIDEFISSGESKWGQQSGVVLLLPHGFEGQGPDHSSGRIERFLQLCANGSMTVAQPSVPANYFHLLRRHCLGPHHSPLVVFTPKQLLRSRQAASQPADFTSGRFHPVIGDETVEPSAVRRIVLTSGRVSYDLESERHRREGDSPQTAIVRLEQLYPLPVEEAQAELARYPGDAELIWVQDEPENQGPWPFLTLKLLPQLDGRRVRAVTRPSSPAPAVGSGKVHAEQQTELLNAVFG